MAIERKFVVEGERRMLIKEYLKKETEKAGFGGIEIQRTPMGTLISLITERPGLIIGRGGKNIKKLTDDLAEKFDMENPQIEIEEVGNKAPLNGQIMAYKVAAALERGWHFRRVGHSTVRRIMSSGARGCQIIISGKITGARHRTEKFTKGHVKYCGEVAKEVMNEGMAVAKKKPGILGIKVRIMKPGAKMPDEIEIISGSVEKAEEEVKEKEKVKKETPAKTIKEEKLEKLTLDELPGLGESMIKKLKKAGIKDVKELYEMSVEDMVGIKGIGIKKAEKLKEAIEKAVK
ncbi:MAG: 30S ribosomal protein S3 [Thermoplasmata archaeon]|nr:MAG: 30S ribosomal protein S3 [Thermoplasmata archaeon]MCD6146968.1 30S ribosomal protein S3 [Thermoplasmata archaeon]RLF46307.1 MAG: 30S ribosomal protein S3 [Thermoplasmata archaeon]RLF49431.1 MAG: 30S ribosomal protein S3 [Thermoplasmata archaeon]